MVSNNVSDVHDWWNSPYLENNHSIIHTTRLIYHLIYLSTTILMVSPLTQASTLRDRYTNHPGLNPLLIH